MSRDLSKQPSRREFLKTSTTAAVGAGVLGISSRAFAGGDDTIRVGLIGAGGRGTGAAAQALSTQGNVKLVAIADAFSDRLDDSLQRLEKKFEGQPGRVAVDQEHRFVGFDAYQNVIDSDVDLVILATPPGFRPIHFDAAVQANKHVFMEKPVATDAPGVRRVLQTVEAAKAKNLKVGVGLQRHHQNHYLEVSRRLQEGEIGDLVSLRVYWNSGGVWDPRSSREQCKTEMEYQMRNWYYYNWLCGDHIVEQHIHNLDVGNWWKGAYPVKAVGMGGREIRTDKKYGEIFDHHAVEFEYADGTRMFSQCRHIPNTWVQVSEHAHGTKGTIDTNDRGARMNSSGKEWRYRDQKNAPYQTEHDDLFAAIRENRAYNEGENGALSTMTAIFGRMASYSGKPLEWDEAINSQISLLPESFAWDAAPVTVPDENGEYPIPRPGVTNVV